MKLLLKVSGVDSLETEEYPLHYYSTRTLLLRRKKMLPSPGLNYRLRFKTDYRIASLCCGHKDLQNKNLTTLSCNLANLQH